MNDNQDLKDNTVSSHGQTRKQFVTYGGAENALVRVLFVGNSITRHVVLPMIGWYRDCGMAASSIEKDYVHIVVSELAKRYGAVRFCIAQLSEWERNFGSNEIMESYSEARDFNADIVVIRIGENIHCNKDDESDLADAFERMVRFLAVKKGCKIIFTDLFWSSKIINSALNEACNRVGGTMVSIGDLGEDATMKALGEYEHKGVSLHPNDNGMRHIAMRILEKC